MLKSKEVKKYLKELTKEYYKRAKKEPIVKTKDSFNDLNKR